MEILCWKRTSNTYVWSHEGAEPTASKYSYAKRLSTRPVAPTVASCEHRMTGSRELVMSRKSHCGVGDETRRGSRWENTVSVARQSQNNYWSVFLLHCAFSAPSASPVINVTRRGRIIGRDKDDASLGTHFEFDCRNRAAVRRSDVLIHPSVDSILR